MKNQQLNIQHRTSDPCDACAGQSIRSTPNTRPKGFTLIEILVVITIIGILMGLLFPAIKGAITKGKCAKAQSEVKSIENAVRAYYTEYGVYPGTSGSDANYGLSSTANGSLISILMSNNTKKVVFLEVPSKSLVGGNFVDPWNNQYEITIDGNYDGNCVGGTYTVNNKPVIVWSWGPDKTKGNKDDILSWQ